MHDSEYFYTQEAETASRTENNQKNLLNCSCPSHISTRTRYERHENNDRDLIRMRYNLCVSLFHGNKNNFMHIQNVNDLLVRVFYSVIPSIRYIYIPCYFIAYNAACFQINYYVNTFWKDDILSTLHSFELFQYYFN